MGELRFAGRVAVVTGAESGIGRATALRILAEGGSILSVDRSTFEPWPEAVAERVQRLEVDVAEDDAPAQVVEALAARGWSPHILVNAAGVLAIAPFLEVNREDWERVLSVNLRGAFFLTQAVARRMIDDGTHGRIVNVSSVHAVVSEPNAAPYTASKGGLEALTRTIATELAEFGITVNCVRPGATWTRMSEPIYTPAILEALSERIPLRQVAPPEWVASAICFLASDEAAYTTGACLDADGGYAMNGALQGIRYG
jgi:NAD(P)-dependent dehydrogenase (short-subunit alcohol dehydrogenase family)